MEEVRDYYDVKQDGDAYSFKACFVSLVGIVVFVLLSLLFGGCSPEVLPLERVETVYKNRTDTVKTNDTIRIISNTVIREARPEDSLLLAQYGVRLLANERMLLFLQKQLEQERSLSREVGRDTVIVRDTIPRLVEVGKRLSWWDEQKIAFGEVAMIIIVGLVALLLVKLYLR